MRDLLESLIGQMIDHGIDFPDAVMEFEKRFIKRVLETSNGNQTRAARVLGIHRNTLSRKLDDLGLDHRPKQRKRPSR